MRKNHLKFKKTLDMVFDRANECCDRGDYISALSTLLNELEQRPDNAEVCAHLADIYAELGLFENGVAMWFKYLLRAKENSYWEGFNGLGACFYFLKNKYLAGYYFNEQLMRHNEIDGVYAGVMEEYLEELNFVDAPKFSIVEERTRESVDREILQRARSFFNDGNSEKALEVLDEIDKSSPIYNEIVLEKAFIQLNGANFIDSYNNLKLCLNSGYKDVTAISLAIDLSASLGHDNNVYKQMLLDYAPSTYEDAYKKLNALCDYELFDDALKVANGLLGDNCNDANTLYIKGFLLYNKGDFKGAERCFKSSYLLSYSYPSLFYLRIAQKAADGNPPYKFLKIEFFVPENFSSDKKKILQGIIKGDKTLADYSERELLDLADWAFSTNDDNLQFSLGWVYIRSGDNVLKRKIKEQLVHPSISDSVKQSLVSILCDITDDLKVKVVYENFFMTLKFNRPELKEENKELFKKAYAKAFGRLSVLNLDKMYRLSIGASELQKELITAGTIGEVKSISALACAMYFYSGLNIFETSDSAYEVFGAKKEDVVKIIKLTENKDET